MDLHSYKSNASVEEEGRRSVDVFFSSSKRRNSVSDQIYSQFLESYGGIEGLKLQTLKILEEADLKLEDEALDILLSNSFMRGSIARESAADDVLLSDQTLHDVKVDFDLLYSVINYLQGVKQDAGRNIHQSGSQLIDPSLIILGIQQFEDFKRQQSLLPFTSVFGDGVAVYDAFRDVPDVFFDEIKQSLVRDYSREASAKDIGEIAASSAVSARLFSRRSDILMKRTASHPQIMFWGDAATGLPTGFKTVISTVDSIRLVYKGEQHLIGIICRGKTGEVCLQGLRTELKVRFVEECRINQGVYCDGHIVLVQGVMDDNHEVFCIYEMMHPPRDFDSEILENDNFFGGELDELALNNLREYELAFQKNSKQLTVPHWLIINEIHFDDARDLAILERVLEVYTLNLDTQPLPTGFVFMGNFSLKKFQFHSREDYANGFQSLFSLLTQKFTEILLNCYLVFVPGPEDASLAKASIPRLPLLSSLTANFKERLEEKFPEAKGKIIFSTNPCRIRHFSRRMIFFRNDIFNDLIWDALKTGSSPVAEDDNKEGGMGEDAKATKDSNLEDLSGTVISTIVGQAHVYPVKADHRILKHSDKSLRLYPMPDLVFLGDKSSPYFLQSVTAGSTEDTLICNADSSFMKEQTFLIYDVFNHTLKKYRVPSWEE